MITPEMLNAESVEKTTRETYEAAVIAPSWDSLDEATKSAWMNPIAKRLTSYLNAEIEAGRGINAHVLWLPDGSWTRAIEGSSPHVTPVLMLRMETE